MNWLAQIITNINAAITSNGIGAITGLVDRTLRGDCFTKTYDDMYNRGYINMGVATTGTVPGSPAFKCFYINTLSTSQQVYLPFGMLIVPALTLCIFKWDCVSWTKQTFATFTPVVGGGDVIDDGGSSVIGNIVIENDTDGKHIIDSGIPIPIVDKKERAIGAYTRVFVADTMIEGICVFIKTNQPTIKIGTSPGGDDISDGTYLVPSNGLQLAGRYTEAGETIYYTVGGAVGSEVYIRFDAKINFYK